MVLGIVIAVLGGNAKHKAHAESLTVAVSLPPKPTH